MEREAKERKRQDRGNAQAHKGWVNLKSHESRGDTEWADGEKRSQTYVRTVIMDRMMGTDSKEDGIERVIERTKDVNQRRDERARDRVKSTPMEAKRRVKCHHTSLTKTERTCRDPKWVQEQAKIAFEKTLEFHQLDIDQAAFQTELQSLWSSLTIVSRDKENIRWRQYVRNLCALHNRDEASITYYDNQCAVRIEGLVTYHCHEGVREPDRQIPGQGGLLEIHHSHGEGPDTNSSSNSEFGQGSGTGARLGEEWCDVCEMNGIKMKGWFSAVNIGERTCIKCEEELLVWVGEEAKCPVTLEPVSEDSTQTRGGTFRSPNSEIRIEVAEGQMVSECGVCQYAKGVPKQTERTGAESGSRGTPRQIEIDYVGTWGKERERRTLVETTSSSESEMDAEGYRKLGAIARDVAFERLQLNELKCPECPDDRKIDQDQVTYSQTEEGGNRESINRNSMSPGCWTAWQVEEGVSFGHQMLYEAWRSMQEPTMEYGNVPGGYSRAIYTRVMYAMDPILIQEATKEGTYMGRDKIDIQNQMYGKLQGLRKQAAHDVRRAMTGNVADTLCVWCNTRSIVRLRRQWLPCKSCDSNEQKQMPCQNKTQELVEWEFRPITQRPSDTTTWWNTMVNQMRCVHMVANPRVALSWIRSWGASEVITDQGQDAERNEGGWDDCSTGHQLDGIAETEIQGKWTVLCEGRTHQHETSTTPEYGRGSGRGTRSGSRRGSVFGSSGIQGDAVEAERIETCPACEAKMDDILQNKGTLGCQICGMIVRGHDQDQREERIRKEQEAWATFQKRETEQRHQVEQNEARNCRLEIESTVWEAARQQQVEKDLEQDRWRQAKEQEHAHKLQRYMEEMTLESQRERTELRNEMEKDRLSYSEKETKAQQERTVEGERLMHRLNVLTRELHEERNGTRRQAEEERQSYSGEERSSRYGVNTSEQIAYMNHMREGPDSYRYMDQRSLLSRDSGRTNATKGSTIVVKAAHAQKQEQTVAEKIGKVVKENEPAAIILSHELIHNCNYGSSPYGQIDMAAVCSKIGIAWSKAATDALQIEIAGSAHVIIVRIFIGLCKIILSKIFDDEDNPYMFAARHEILPAAVQRPLADLFNQIQHIFATPTAKAGATGIVANKVGVALHKMTGAEIETMVAPWRVHDAEDQSAAAAEASAIIRMKDRIRDLLRLRGGLSISKTAVAAYEAQHFETDWKKAMAQSGTDIPRWATGWWSEKLDRLRRMIVAEVRDEIGNYKTYSRQNGGNQYVRYIVDTLIQTGETGVEFTGHNINLEDDRGLRGQPQQDRGLIIGLFNQLPNHDVRWKAAIQKRLLPSSLRPVGIKVETADDFSTIIALVTYTIEVCEALIGAQLEDQMQLMKRQQAEMEARMTAEIAAAVAQLRPGNANEPMNRTTQPRRLTANINTIGEASYQRQDDHDIQSEVRDHNLSRQANHDTIGHTVLVNSSSRNAPISELLYKPQCFDHLWTSQSESEKFESSQDTYTGPVFDMYFVNSVSFQRTLSASLDSCISRLRLDKIWMDTLYPSAIMDYAKRNQDGIEVHLASIAALVRYTRSISDKQVSQEFMGLICGKVYAVVQRIGGSLVTDRDIGGCERKIPGYMHSCKGSHSMNTCPQASTYPSSGPPMHPSLVEICQQNSPDHMMQRCRDAKTERHSSDCRGKEGRLASCKIVVEYIHQLVYPGMYERMITLLDDTNVSCSDKQEYRVQLAAGLLTAVWSLRGL